MSMDVVIKSLAFVELPADRSSSLDKLASFL